MSSKTRKRIRSMSLVMSLAIIGALAAFIVLANDSGSTAAHGGEVENHCDDLRTENSNFEQQGRTRHDRLAAASANPHTCADGSGNPDDTSNGATMMLAAGDKVTSDSNSGGGAPEFQVMIESLPNDLAVGSSIVLYLEDDYQEPATIPTSSVYFVAESPTSEETGSGARVYITIAPKIDTDAYFDADKSDISIRVFIPDMCTSSTEDCQGPNGVDFEQMLTMVIEDSSGIKNPTEAGSHSAAFKILGPTAPVPGPAAVNKDYELKTVAKISLSDVNNSRGYQLVVVGSGFNDGTTATAWVLGRQVTTAEWWNALDCPEMNALVDPEKAVADAEMGTSPCTMYDGLDATAGGHKSIVDAADTTKGLRRKGCLPGDNR